MSIASQEFSCLTSLLKTETAVVLESGKEYLVEARLSILAREEGFSSVSQLISRVIAERDTPLATRALYALTTAETSFFRDPSAFEVLQNTIIPHLLTQRRHSKPLTIWSAACASGQEAYSLAILLRDSFPETPPPDVQIIATDLNPELILKATSGLYSSHEINRGLPARHLVQYFHETPRGFRVNEELRHMITFSQVNLIKSLPSWEVDLLLLRNVLIYFDEESRTRVLTALHRRMNPHGVLVLGTAENASAACPGFRPANIPGINAFFRI